MNTTTAPVNQDPVSSCWSNTAPSVSPGKTEPIPIPREYNLNLSYAQVFHFRHAWFERNRKFRSVFSVWDSLFPFTQSIAAFSMLNTSDSVGDKHALRWSAMVTFPNSGSTVSISSVFKSKKDADKVRFASFRLGLGSSLQGSSAGSAALGKQPHHHFREPASRYRTSDLPAEDRRRRDR